MNEPLLRILYVDDEPGLLEIGKIYLESSGRFRVDTITSAREALSALEAGDYHAIVSDYQMPDMDGIVFLKEVRRRYGDIPFILFTGRGREEVVIDAINNGADFYLQKGGDPSAQFAELAHKIRQAAGRRSAELALKDSEKRLSDIIDFLPDATFAIDRAGRVIAWNRAIEEMAGVPAAEMVGKGGHEYAVPFYGDRRKILIDLVFQPDEVIRQHYANISREKGVLTADTNLPRPKGRIVTLMGKASPLYDRQGEIVGAIESIRDVTDLKNAAKELREQYNTLAKSGEQIRENELRLTYMLGFYGMAKQPEGELLSYAVEGAGAVTASPLGYLAFLNDDESVLTMYAWSKAAMAECAMREKPITYPVEKTGLWGEAVRQRRPVITNDYQAADIRKKGYPEGHPHIIRHMNVPVIDDGRIVIVAGVANKPQDYTKTEVRELTLLMQGLWQVLKARRAEQELRAANEQLVATDEELRGQYEELAAGEQRVRESEARFRDLAGLLPQIVFEMDQDLRVTYANESAFTMIGLTPEDIARGTGALSFIDPGDHARAHRALQAVARGETSEEYEYTVLRKDGSRFPALIYTAPVTRSGAFAGFRGVIVDISDRKEAEDALRESEKKFRDLFNNLTDAVYIHEVLPDGLPGRILEVNDVMCSRLGYRHEELLSMQVTGIVSEEHRKKMAGIRGQMERDGSLTFYAEHKRKDGIIIPVEVKSQIRVLSERRVALAVARDISARKKAEDALRESEEKYRTVVEQSTDAIFIAQDGRLVFSNRAFAAMTGYSGPELEGRSIADLIAPEDRDLVLTRHRERLGGKIHPDTYEFSVLHHDGATRIRVVMHVSALTFDGKPATLGTLHDVTGERQREAALQESEEKFRTIIENMQDIVYRTDPAGNLTMASPSFATLLGYDSLDECIGKNIPEQFWMEPSRRKDFLDALERDGSVTGYEIVLRHKNGTPVMVSASSHFYYSRNGTIAGVEGIFHDITAIRKAQQQIQILAGLNDTSPASVIVHTPGGEMLYANQRTFEMHGWTRDEFMALNLHRIDVPASEQLIHRRVEELRIRGETAFEVGHYRKDGSIIPLHVNTRIIRWNDRDVIMSVATDISDLKRAQDAARESEDEFRRLISGSFDAIIVHQDGRIVLANERAARIMGAASPDQLAGRPVIDLVHPDFRSKVRERLLELDQVLSAAVPLIEEQFIRLDGTPVDVEVLATTSRHGGRPAVMVVFRDISDRKRTEAELQAACTDLSAAKEELRSRFDELKKSQVQLRISEEKYRRITDNARDMIYRMSLPDGRYEYVSPASAALTGYSPEEFYADPVLIRRLIHPAWQDFFRQQWEALLRGTVPPSYEYQIIDRSGKIRWFNQRNVLVTGDNGQPAAIEGIVTDVTEHRQAEEALRMANRKLNLLSSMTRHDILNKISIALGFLKLTMQKNPDPALHTYLERIGSAITAIRSHIEFTRAYQDLGTHDPRWIDLDPIIPRAHVPAGVILNAGVQGISVCADLMLEKVFYNLLDNSIRHGDHVTEIRIFTRNAGGDLVIVWEDNGAGIAADEKERIFEQGFGKNYGFGLFLSREILSITGITIRESGVPGSGARFEITVPAGSWRRSGEDSAQYRKPAYHS